LTAAQQFEIFCWEPKIKVLSHV